MPKYPITLKPIPRGPLKGAVPIARPRRSAGAHPSRPRLHPKSPIPIRSCPGPSAPYLLELWHRAENLSYITPRFLQLSNFRIARSRAFFFLEIALPLIKFIVLGKRRPTNRGIILMEELHTCRIDGGGSPYIGQVTWWGEDALQQILFTNFFRMSVCLRGNLRFSMSLCSQIFVGQLSKIESFEIFE